MAGNTPTCGSSFGVEIGERFPYQHTGTLPARKYLLAIKYGLKATKLETAHHCIVARFARTPLAIIADPCM